MIDGMAAGCLALGCLVMGAQAGTVAGGAQRVAPPAGLACARDQLTSYAGSLQSAQREAGTLRLVIATDWDSTETVVVAHRNRPEAQRQFTIEDRPFTAADWPRIEASPGRLRPGLRLVAWVCEDGRTPALIDWRPGAAAAPPRP